MNSTKIIATLIFVLSVALFSGCTKEGPAGKDGNANVSSTTLTASNWVYSAPSWVATLPYSAITQEIVNSGAVLVYIKVGESYNQLPLTFYQTDSYSTTIEVSTSPGQVTLFWTDSDLIQPDNPGSQSFKVVAIAAATMIDNPDLDYSSYDEVMSTFGLED